jgi:hypothetical protein
MFFKDNKIRILIGHQHDAAEEKENIIQECSLYVISAPKLAAETCLQDTRTTASIRGWIR